MLKLLAPILLLAAFSALVIDTYAPAHLLRYDEADYLYAAEQGFVDNYVDANALPLTEFITTGVSSGGDLSKRAELSELVRERGDVSFFRHYHGPLYFYWVMLGGSLGITGERGMRIWCMLLLGLLAMVAFLAARRIHRLSVGWSLLPALLLLGSPINIFAAAQITPHALFGVTSLVALVLLVRATTSGVRGDWYAAVTALALAFLTIEYALLVAATFVAGAWVARRRLADPGEWPTFILRSLGLFLLVIGVLWAGGLVKLTLVKNYVFFAYFSIVRASAYGSGGFLDVWAEHFANAPVACGIALGALVVGAARLRRNPDLLPYLLYPALVLLTSIRNASLSPTYVSSIFPPLFLLAAITLEEILGRRPRWVSWATAAVVAAASALTLPAPVDSVGECDERLLSAVVDAVGALPRRDSSLLVPREHLPILHYYHRRTRRFTGFALDLDDSLTLRRLAEERGITGAITYASTDSARFRRLLPHFTRRSVDTVPAPCDDTFAYFQSHPQ